MFYVFCGQKNENVYASLCIGMIRGAVGLQRVEGGDMVCVKAHGGDR